MISRGAHGFYLRAPACPAPAAPGPPAGGGGGAPEAPGGGAEHLVSIFSPFLEDSRPSKHFTYEERHLRQPGAQEEEEERRLQQLAGVEERQRPLVAELKLLSATFLLSRPA